jgi:hypothetical protein
VLFAPKNILSLNENENLKRGNKKTKQKDTMSLCKNEKKSKRGTVREKPILSLYENENLKRGEQKKKLQKTCPHAKMKKIIKGDGRKKPILSVVELGKCSSDSCSDNLD